MTDDPDARWHWTADAATLRWVRGSPEWRVPGSLQDVRWDARGPVLLSRTSSTRLTALRLDAGGRRWLPIESYDSQGVPWLYCARFAADGDVVALGGYGESGAFLRWHDGVLTRRPGFEAFSFDVVRHNGRELILMEAGRQANAYDASSMTRLWSRPTLFGGTFSLNEHQALLRSADVDAVVGVADGQTLFELPRSSQAPLKPPVMLLLADGAFLFAEADGSLSRWVPPSGPRERVHHRDDAVVALRPGPRGTVRVYYARGLIQELSPRDGWSARALVRLDACDAVYPSPDALSAVVVVGGAVVLVDLTREEAPVLPAGPYRSIQNLQFAPNSQRLLCTATEEPLRVLETARGEVMLTCEGEDLRFAALEGTGETVVALHRNGFSRFDLTSGERVARTELGFRLEPQDVVWSPAGWVAAISIGYVEVFSLEEPDREPWSDRWDEMLIGTAAFPTPTTVRVFLVAATAALVSTVEFPTGSASFAEWPLAELPTPYLDPRAGRVLLRTPTCLEVRDVLTGELQWTAPYPAGTAQYGSGTFLLGLRRAVVGGQGVMDVLDAGEGSRVCTLRWTPGWDSVATVDLSPDERLLAVGTMAGRILLFELPGS